MNIAKFVKIKQIERAHPGKIKPLDEPDIVHINIKLAMIFI